MKDKTVSFETAVLARDKGFPQDTLGMNEFSLISKEITNKHFGDNVKAPTQTSLQTWLREKHRLHISVVRYIYWYAAVEIIDEKTAENRTTDIISQDYDSFEQALEAGLFLALYKEQLWEMKK